MPPLFFYYLSDVKHFVIFICEECYLNKFHLLLLTHSIVLSEVCIIYSLFCQQSNCGVPFNRCIVDFVDNWWVSAPDVLTDGLHHAGLSGVSLHWNDILETMQRDDALSSVPDLQNLLHFGAQFLSHRRERQRFNKHLIYIMKSFRVSVCYFTLEVFSPLWYSKAS